MVLESYVNIWVSDNSSLSTSATAEALVVVDEIDRSSTNVVDEGQASVVVVGKDRIRNAATYTDKYHYGSLIVRRHLWYTTKPCSSQVLRIAAARLA